MVEIDYGKAIKTFREDLGMTRKDFYTKAGITQSRLSQLENNTFAKPEQTVKEVLKKFDVSFPDFLVVYGGYTYENKSFDSFEALREYKEAKDKLPPSNPDDYKKDITELSEYHEMERFIDTLEYLNDYASNDERRTIMDLVDFYQFRKYDKKDYQKWLVERSKEQDKSTPE